MKARTIPLLFLLVAAGLAGVFFLARYFVKEKQVEEASRAKVVNLKSEQEEDTDADYNVSSLGVEKYETFVPLLSNETLISTSNFDFNNDGYDDEVIAVRKIGSEILWLVPGLYNPDDGSYSRMEQIATPFSRTRTFSYGGMDLIGNHTNALLYQGVDDDGNYVMQVFLCREYSEGKLFFESVGNFISDGTVFVQQTDRHELYELGLADGESYSIWVYKSDIPEGMSAEKREAANLNQIQQEYKWDPDKELFELSREIKVTASRLAAKELSRIQNGTVETFAEFLEGLWYKTSNTDGQIRYMYFDYNKSEIIQLVGDSQEIYEWEDSKLRHNGIYLTTVNADIINLHRRFDITLVNTDEIRLSLWDAINLNIKTSSEWDGNYKKMTSQASFQQDEEKEIIESFSSRLSDDTVWVSSDDSVTLTFKNDEYTLQNNEITETGIYSLLRVGPKVVIQFRSDSDFSWLDSAYTMEFGTKIITETIKKKTVEKTVTDYDSIKFSPVKFTPTECFAAEGRSLVLGREN